MEKVTKAPLKKATKSPPKKPTKSPPKAGSMEDSTASQTDEDESSLKDSTKEMVTAYEESLVQRQELLKKVRFFKHKRLGFYRAVFPIVEGSDAKGLLVYFGTSTSEPNYYSSIVDYVIENLGVKMKDSGVLDKLFTDANYVAQVHFALFDDRNWSEDFFISFAKKNAPKGCRNKNRNWARGNPEKGWVYMIVVGNQESIKALSKYPKNLGNAFEKLANNPLPWSEGYEKKKVVVEKEVVQSGEEAKEIAKKKAKKIAKERSLMFIEPFAGTFFVFTFNSTNGSKE